MLSACGCGVYDHSAGDMYAVWVLLGGGRDGVEAGL